MCGIIGIWNKSGKPVMQDLLIKMREIMYARGPDNAGIWTDGQVGLGHRRLSIIDLSSLGHQPMIDEETGSVIVYNGEIYNFLEIKKDLEKDGIIFKSKTDTEVVLKAYRMWGGNCVSRFNGMFAFAVWDMRRKGLFIARDRLGIKPLYYYFNNKVFLFASRLGALMIHPSCPRTIDPEALGLFLESGYVPAPWSILEDVKKLRPGHSLWIDEKGISENCYWNMDTISIDSSLEKSSDEELIEKLDELLRDSVKLRLVSDVPLGTFLSGGIDSSLVTAIMCQHTHLPPKTFTIGFEEKSYDESFYARKIAEHLGTDHHEKIMKSDDLLSLLDDNTLHYDEPFADFSSLPTMLVSHFAREQVTVALSGDGGDELFAGYRDYIMWKYLQPFYRMPHSLRIFAGSALSKMLSRRYEVIGQSFSQKDILKGFMMLRSFKESGRTLFSGKGYNLEKLLRERSSHFPDLDTVSKFCRLDAVYYLPDDILQKVDVASMSVSLEARVPILDHRIVEFSQSLPVRYKIRGMRSKWLLKKVLSRYVPPALFERTKRGFVAPIKEWFRGELKEVLYDELSPLKVKQFGYLDPDSVQGLIDLHISNKQDTHHLLWALLSLFRWNEHVRRQGNAG